jgi:catechol 2,3-dioxygenase-like lactoylglutathione lyase family enzyme
MLKGVNHIAVMTADLDRFVEFYTQVFDMEMVFSEDTPTFRHAILRAGPDSWVHPIALTEPTDDGKASPSTFHRGHLDHFALTASSPQSFDEARSRLSARDACGTGVDCLGPFRSVWFTDPDGMRGELVLITDASLQGIHEPRPE